MEEGPAPATKGTRLPASSAADETWEDGGGRWLAGFLAFAAVGLAVGAGCDCVVDLRERTVRLAWARVPRRWVSYPLDEVERFAVLEGAAPAGRSLRAGRGEYTLGMRLRGGEEVSLTRQYSTSLSQRLVDIAGVLERFRRSAETPPATRR